MAVSYVFHPVLLFLTSNIILTLTAAFTKRDSPLRFAALFLLASIAIIFPTSLTTFAKTTGWAGRIPAGAALWNCVTCFDRFILRKWDYEHYGPIEEDNQGLPEKSMDKASQSKVTQYAGSRIDFGSDVSGLARGIGHFWQVKNVPHFSTQNPNLVPSVGAFVLVQGVAVVACYFIHNLTVAVTFNLDLHLLDSKYISLLSRLQDVSTPELMTRFVASIGYWILQYTLLQFHYSLFGLIAVVSSSKDIQLWRPIFGNPTDAYTIRNFWGKSWHQDLRSGLEGVSNFLTHDVLNLPSHGVLQRYTKIFFSFAVSGLMHMFADMGGGLSMRQSGALQFFCVQALGIMIEDGVQALYMQYRKGRTKGSAITIERLVGYVWVLFFIVWTSPVWVFPAQLQMPKEDALLSLSAIKPLFSGR